MLIKSCIKRKGWGFQIFSRFHFNNVQLLGHKRTCEFSLSPPGPVYVIPLSRDEMRTGII